MDSLPTIVKLCQQINSFLEESKLGLIWNAKSLTLSKSPAFQTEFTSFDLVIVYKASSAGLKREVEIDNETDSFQEIEKLIQSLTQSGDNRRNDYHENDHHGDRSEKKDYPENDYYGNKSEENDFRANEDTSDGFSPWDLNDPDDAAKRETYDVDENVERNELKDHTNSTCEDFSEITEPGRIKTGSVKSSIKFERDDRTISDDYLDVSDSTRLDDCRIDQNGALAAETDREPTSENLLIRRVERATASHAPRKSRKIARDGKRRKEASDNGQNEHSEMDFGMLLSPNTRGGSKESAASGNTTNAIRNVACNSVKNTIRGINNNNSRVSGGGDVYLHSNLCFHTHTHTYTCIRE